MERVQLEEVLSIVATEARQAAKQTIMVESIQLSPIQMRQELVAADELQQMIQILRLVQEVIATVVVVVT